MKKHGKSEGIVMKEMNDSVKKEIKIEKTDKTKISKGIKRKEMRRKKKFYYGITKNLRLHK